MHTNLKPTPLQRKSTDTSKNKSQLRVLIIGLITGIIISITIMFVVMNLLPSKSPNPNSPINRSSQNQQETTEVNEDKPLYWVAPMDANFRRDKPGLSPMGMDLIPYYANKISDDKDEGAGTIKISPNVINNLGVRTTKVRYTALTNTIETVGYVTYDEDKLIHIHPRVTGWVEKLYINAVGDPIKKGEPLYDLYSPELVNAQEEFMLVLSGSNQQLIDAAEKKLTALKISLKTIAELKENRKVKQHITFFAPQSGVIESLDIRSGFYVEPATMMLSIVDLTKVWVKAEVFESDIFNIAMGDNVTMALDYLPAKKWQGKVDHIHPIINPKTRTGIVRLHFDNPSSELKPNMFAQISITTRKMKPTLQIPREALIRTGTQNRVVLALGDGYFKSVTVQVGRFGRDNIEILSGLAEGEEVVSSAQFLLDSESSKSSDFKRMNAQPFASENDNVATATVNGTVTRIMVNSLMKNQRMVSIDREAIDKWGREAANVDFIVAESVDMSLFSVGAYLMFTFEVNEGEFIIISAMPMNPTTTAMPMADSMPKMHEMHEMKGAEQ